MADLRIISQTLPLAFAGDAYSVRLQALGGTPPYTWSLQAGTLPTGLSLDGTSGELTAAISTLLATEVGDHSLTFRVTDNVAATHDLVVTLTLRPANYRRTSVLMLDPRLENLLSIWDVGVASRAQVIAHFAQAPFQSAMLSGGEWIQDGCLHWADQICYGEAPASPATPAPASPGLTLWDKIQELDNGGKILAEPQIITVSAYSSSEISATDQTVSGFGPASALLGEGLGVRILGQDFGPVYNSPDKDLGYSALAQRFTLPAAANPSSVTLYLNRLSSPASMGNLVVGLSTASPANIHIPAGSTSLAWGDGTALVASGSLDLSTVSLDAARSIWEANDAYSVGLTLNSPYTGLNANTNYYLVVAADFNGSPFLELAASIDDVGSLVAGTQAIGLSAGAGSPYHSPASAVSLVLQAPFENAASPQSVTSIAFELEAAWTGATVGIISLAVADPYATSPTLYNRYWVGDSAATAADTRAAAFKVINGHDRSSGSAVLDLTNFDEIVDAYGNQVSIIEVQTTAGAEVNPSGGGQTDADGFLTTGGSKLRVQLLPNSRGTLPELPLRVLAGGRRRLSNLDPDSLIRTANKTGSTDAAILAALAATTPSNPLLSINQLLKPDASGNLDLTTSTGALAWNINPGSYEAELQFAGQVLVTNQGSSPTAAVDFSSVGVLTLDAADSSITLTPLPGSNKIQISANSGITTLNNVAPDGSGGLTLVAGVDAAHAGQTFTTLATGSAPNTVAVGTNIPDATALLAGLLGIVDKSRLDALFSGLTDVTPTDTGAVSGGHSHKATSMAIGRTLSGYSTLLSTTNVADAIEAINVVLAAQFTAASEAPNLTTATTTYSAFGTGYLSNSADINYSSPGHTAGDLVTDLTEAASGTVITVTSAPFGNPGNAGRVFAQLSDSPGASSPWTTLDTLDLDQTYSAALSAIGGSPPNYTSVASQMQANPKTSGGGPTSKVSFQSVAYSGLDTGGAPVFELQVKMTPVLSDMNNALGHNQIRLFQNTGVSTHASTAVTLTKDQFAGVSDPLINQAIIQIQSTVTPVWVSGVPHYAAATNPAFRVDVDNIYDIAYVQQPARIWDVNDSPTATIFQYYQTETASPQDATWIPSPDEVFHLGIAAEPHVVATENMLFLVNDQLSRGLTLEITDAHGVQATQALIFTEPATSPGRLLHLGRRGLSAGGLQSEAFSNEKYRLDVNDWGGVDLVSPVASPVFSLFTVQPAGQGTTDANTYGWPNETALTEWSAINTWNASTGSPGAAFRSGVSLPFPAGTLASLPAAVNELGLTHPGHSDLYNYNDNLFAPAISSPYNAYGALGSPLNYFDAYSSRPAVVYHRLFQSTTATNQGRLRVYGYKRGAASPSATALSHEDLGSPVSMSHMSGSFLNIGPASSPTPTMTGLSLEVKFAGPGKTPKGNPGATGWLDMNTTPGSSLYAAGEDGYGALDTAVHSPGMTQGSGYVDIYWRSGAFTTGLSNNQAVVRVGMHDKGWVITGMDMLNQSTDTPWSNGT